MKRKGARLQSVATSSLKDHGCVNEEYLETKETRYPL